MSKVKWHQVRPARREAMRGPSCHSASASSRRRGQARPCGQGASGRRPSSRARARSSIRVLPPSRVPGSMKIRRGEAWVLRVRSRGSREESRLERLPSEAMPASWLSAGAGPSPSMPPPSSAALKRSRRSGGSSLSTLAAVIRKGAVPASRGLSRREAMARGDCTVRTFQGAAPAASARASSTAAPRRGGLPAQSTAMISRGRLRHEGLASHSASGTVRGPEPRSTRIGGLSPAGSGRRMPPKSRHSRTRFQGRK